MSLKNIYLEDTPLTSTRNKYLGEPLPKRFRNLQHFLRYEDEGENIGAGETFLDTILSKKSALVSTENKFLIKVQSSPPCFGKKIKKKRRARCAVRSRRIYYSRSRSASREIAGEPIAQACSNPVGFSLDETDFNGIETLSCDDELDDMPELFVLRDLAEDVCESLGTRAFSENDAQPAEARGMCFGAAPTYSDSGIVRMAMRAAPNRIFLKSEARGPPGGLAAAFSNKLVVNIDEMPMYNFELAEGGEQTERTPFESLEAEYDMYQMKQVQRVKAQKLQLLNVASMALIYSSNLKDSNDSYRLTLQKCADEVRMIDPEFILKVALYARQELNIRAVSNFLLSYASVNVNTRMYLKKYFEASIVLPSDWMEVAEYCTLLGDEKGKTSLPAALKRVMKQSFKKFDAYQLAKYNRNKAKKGTKKVSGGNTKSQTSDELKKPKTFTLKHLIRLLHIDSPVDHVLCLLGKKYPESHQEFLSSRLSGTWDSKRAGTRMKLPLPVTWETQISSRGNKPEVWEYLINESKLPYMAMLRNLKNLILSGISPDHHNKVLKQLENKHAVVKSRQSPSQFFEAYKVIVNLENMLVGENVAPSKAVPAWKTAQRQKIVDKLPNASVSLLQRYKSAICNAVQISSLNNLHPIPGKTLVICETAPSEQVGVKAMQNNLMMGLICLRACEDCEMHVVCGNHDVESVIIPETCEFLDFLIDMCEKYEEDDIYNHSNHIDDLLNYLKPQQMLTTKLDNLIYLKSTKEEDSSKTKESILIFIEKYRQLVNSELLYTEVDFIVNKKDISDVNFSPGKDVYLCGYSNQLLKFIADRTNGGLLPHVENIDKRYNLQDIPYSELKKSEEISVYSQEQEELLPFYETPKWHCVRIFISSTFKDMHSERDLLVRYIIPELRKRAASIFVRINEVDLRWGITEKDSSTKRAAELCLMEAQACDLFIGLLGERYGTIYDFEPPDSPDLLWVKDYLPGLSITELEMHAGALRKPDSAKDRAFFYFRDSSFMWCLPEKWKAHFESEDDASKSKVEELKSKIKASGLNVLEKYPCTFAGILDNKPIIDGLEEFGKAVLYNLWQAIKKIHSEDPFANTITEEETYQENLLNANNTFYGEKNFPVTSLVNKIMNNCGTFVISGASGSGKTAFVIHLLKKLADYPVVKFFIGVSPRSVELSYMLQYICKSISQQFPVSAEFPKFTDDLINHLPDVLDEAVNATGTKSLILLIDGLDHLELDAQRLDWLPFSLPNGLRIIFTASDNSLAFKALCERQSYECPMYFESLTALQQSDREHFVRNYLKIYGKSLDESAFSNHLLLLVTKRDSGIPSYLRIACDYLRIFASFENFLPTLQKLPSTTSSLLKEVIVQLETEFGLMVTQTLLTFLCITKEGVDEGDLYFVLSFALLKNDSLSCSTLEDTIYAIQTLKPENLYSQVKYSSLIHIISTFAYGNNRHEVLNLVGSEFEEVIKRYYQNKNFENYSRHLHMVLGAYYYAICDPKMDGGWKGNFTSAFRALFYHLINGLCYEELAFLLCQHNFLVAVFKVKADDQLLDYYQAILHESKRSQSNVSKKIDFPLVASYSKFIAKNMHIFQLYPHLVIQQALNEPLDSLIKAQDDAKKIGTVECLTRASVNDYRRVTLSGFVKNITAVACDRSKSFAVLGSEDGCLKILDLTSNKIIRNLKSHSSAITFICFAGKNRICASSADTTLSIWNSEDFNRIAVLNGHRHNVTCCCADPSGSTLFSSGWDNSVRLWSLSDGRSLSIIDSFRCPVGCIDHHPYKQQIACGLWNGNIEIWDTLSMQLQFTLRCLNGSVKSVAYTPDGINIISSTIGSEVEMWSSEEGLKISNLKGHILPVRSISCSYAENFFVSGSDDSTLKVWCSEAAVSVSTLSDCKFCPVRLLEFISPYYLAVAFQNSEIWIMDINNGSTVSKMMLAPGVVTCFSRYSSHAMKGEDNKGCLEATVVFGMQSGEVMVGNISTAVIGNIGSSVTALAHETSAVICGSANGDIGVFNVIEEVKPTIMRGAHQGSVTAVTWFAGEDSVYILSVGSDNVLKVWEDNILKLEFSNMHNDLITCCTAHPSDVKLFEDDSGSLHLEGIVTGSHDNNVIFWGDGNSERLFKGLQTSVANIWSSKLGILGCGKDGSIVIWSLDGRILRKVPGNDQSSEAVAFFVNKGASYEFDVTLAFVDIDGSVHVKKPLQRTYWYSLEGHNRSITSCCASDEGEVISCSLDRTVNIWKVPLNVPDANFNHSSTITDLILSQGCDLAASSDAQGNVVLWKVVLTSDKSPLEYASKKMYTRGYVRALSWWKDKSLIAAVTQTLDDKEKYFLDILQYDEIVSSNEQTVYNLNTGKSYCFRYEIMCIDSSPSRDVILVGCKNGHVDIISAEQHRYLFICEDWIWCTKLFTFKDNTDAFCVSMLSGVVKYYTLTEVMSSKLLCVEPKKTFKLNVSDKVIYTSVLYCSKIGEIFCGDVAGNLKFFFEESSRTIEKAHSEAITGICMAGPNIFTCSLDRTVKGWNKYSLEQVCQFHLSVPICCLTVPEISEDSSAAVSHLLLIGTTSGIVHLLKFHPNTLPPAVRLAEKA